MGVSADVSAGNDALASQYNNLRQDVNHDTLSHGHTAISRDGKLIGLDALAQEVLDNLGAPLKPLSSDLVGDGSDGDVIINAPTTIEGVKNYNNLTLNDVITPASGKHFLFIFVKETLTINNGGGLDAIGFGAAGGPANTPGSDGFVLHFGALPAETLGGIGGGSATPGRRGGEQIAAAADAGEDIFLAYGAGGGGGAAGGGGDIWAGGGGGRSSSSAGGNGGGCIIVFADTIVVNAGGSIQADGAIGVGTPPNGGGGGGGGLVYLAYRNLTNNGTISADGGAGPAEDGGDGMVVEKIIPS